MTPYNRSFDTDAQVLPCALRARLVHTNRGQVYKTMKHKLHRSMGVWPLPYTAMWEMGCSDTQPIDIGSVTKSSYRDLVSKLAHVFTILFST